MQVCFNLRKWALLGLCFLLLGGKGWAQSEPDIAPPSRTPGLKSRPDISILLDLFEQSKAFVPAANLLWFDYEARSTGGVRPYQTGLIVPPLGVHYERQLLRNLGVRGYLSSHWWEEERPLAQAGTRLFTERFVYQYWTAGVGLTWHFAVSPQWDPYVGYMLNYRRATGACDCVSETTELRTRNFLIGTRYLLTPAFFLSAEIGAHGSGTFKVGAGFDF